MHHHVAMVTQLRQWSIIATPLVSHLNANLLLFLVTLEKMEGELACLLNEGRTVPVTNTELVGLLQDYFDSLTAGTV